MFFLLLKSSQFIWVLTVFNGILAATQLNFLMFLTYYHNAVRSFIKICEKKNELIFKHEFKLENRKLGGVPCSDILNECDASKKLTCYPTPSGKVCA